MSDWVTCGNCGAANPAEAVTCRACGVILAAYRSPAGATASGDTELSRSPQDATPKPRPLPPGSSPSAPTHLLSPGNTSAEGADWTIASSKEALSPQTDPSGEFAPSQDSEIRVTESGDGQTSDDHGKRGGEAAIQTPGSLIRPLDGSSGTDLRVSPEAPAVPRGVVADPRGDKPREHGAVLVQPATDQGMPAAAGPIVSPPSRPAPQRIVQEHRLPPESPGTSPPFVKPSPLPDPARTVSRDTPLDHPAGRRPGRDPLGSVSGQVLVLVGLGLVLTSCLLGALVGPGTMPAAVTLVAFCVALTGMVLIVIGAIILVARRSGRPI